VPIKVQQPNGVDFCIAFYLGGYLTGTPDTEYVILSKDKKGFDPLVQHLAGQRGFRARRVNSQAEAFAASAKATGTKAIKKNGEKKLPRKRTRLEGKLKSWLPSMPPKERSALLTRLFEEGPRPRGERIADVSMKRFT